jgi:hypothetical protein
MKALQTRMMKVTATVAILGASIVPTAAASVGDQAGDAYIQPTQVDLQSPDTQDAAALANQGYVVSPGVAAPTTSLTTGGNGWTDAGIGGAGVIVLAGGLVLAMRMHKRPTHRPVLQ